ncbi:MAG: UxaA family hydrolase [Lacipirellulaceae bacterium]
MGSESNAAENQVHLLHINPADNVAIAVLPLEAGYQATFDGSRVTVREDVNLGAKIALVDIGFGQKVIKFGEPIGSASTDIEAGEYVHTHNLQSDYIPTASH